MITILTWLWRQPNARIEYTTAHVNAWAEAIRRNTTVPHRIACVTDIPEGLDPSIHVIAPPRDFEHIRSRHWQESNGLPQCYRRIAMFSPDAASVFGERFLCLDIDMLILGNIDHILTMPDDFAIFRGTSKDRPYNGGMVLMTAGARPQVYTQFTQAGADLASSQMVGSDQAWISHCLGRGEKTIGEDMGVTHYSPRFIRQNGGHENFKPPKDICMLFFPGNVKAFHGARSVWRGTIADQRIIDALRGHKPARYLAYDDPKGWGREMRKHGFELVTNLRTVRPEDTLFVRLDQQGEQRDISRNLLLNADAMGCTTFPARQDALWYDDKIEQHNALAEWLPETHIFRDAEQATAYAINFAEYPLISKATNGAASSNVRMITDEFQAIAEIVEVFGDGIPQKYGRKQQGYVYFQKFIPGNTCDYRVVVTGDYAHGLVRLNKPGTPFASGSGNNYPIRLASDRERIAMETAWQAAQKIGTRWCAFDIVFDADNRPYILEISAAWTVQSYYDCVMYDGETMTPTTSTGRDVFRIAAGEIRGVPETLEITRRYVLLRSGTTFGKKGDIVAIGHKDAEILMRNRIAQEHTLCTQSN